MKAILPKSETISTNDLPWHQPGFFNAVYNFTG
jgi:hypothetical protein